MPHLRKTPVITQSGNLLMCERHFFLIDLREREREREGGGGREGERERREGGGEGGREGGTPKTTSCGFSTGPASV